MKWIGFAIFLVSIALCAGCISTNPQEPGSLKPTTSDVPVTPTIPNVIGMWTGMTYGHSQIEGFRQHDKSKYKITNQEGYAFSGSKEYIRQDGKTYYENFSGVISDKGEISMADNPRGYNYGKLTGNDTMELYYLEDGPEAKAYLSFFNRVKN